MEIKIQLKNSKVLCIIFGRKTKWQECIYWFHIMIEEYDNPDKPKEVSYAWFKLGLFPEKGFKESLKSLKNV